MSVSIGIGVDACDEGFVQCLRNLADKFGYSISAGIASFESDVQQGIERLVEIKGWKEVFVLRAPSEDAANLAFGVYKELIDLQSSGVRPKFFEFCTSLDQSASEHGLKTVGVFFATEWYAEDRIRMSYGNLPRLLTILSLPGHWAVNTLNPQTGRMDEWDELPFFYELECGNK